MRLLTHDAEPQGRTSMREDAASEFSERLRVRQGARVADNWT